MQSSATDATPPAEDAQDSPVHAPVSVAVRVALVWIGLILVVAVFADVFILHEPTALGLRNRLAPPVFFGGGWSHPLGTDELGRCVYSRLVMSIRASLLIAFGATLIGAFVGTSLGLVAAHFRGWVDQAVMALVDLSASIPFLIIALAVLAFFGNSMVLLIGLLGLNAWERYARITRGLTISSREQGYVQAVRQIGARPARIYGRHVLPNIASTLIVSMTLAFPEVVLLESGLSFLGLGVQPPATSLGNMVGFGREFLSNAPWIMLAPALVITLTTLATSLVGDWLRDRLDPTLA